MNQLEQLTKMTTIVADTGDIEAIKQHAPTDATTNPSLILKAAEIADYKPLVDEAVSYAKAQGLPLLMDRLFVNFGTAITKIIPGRVSTEVDARLSFNVKGSIAKARSLIAMYEALGVPRERILIKLASTWEGILAAKELESDGIHCNMTLLFSMPQAIACADAKATLISPFVGRILDWYKKSEGVEGYPPEKDPGVVSVTEIYNTFKHFDIPTEVMGASFRNKDEIIELAGCDLLTIAPSLLDELKKETSPIERKLDPKKAKTMTLTRPQYDESSYRLAFCENAMATEKLAEGIRNFGHDAQKLETMIHKNYQI